MGLSEFNLIKRYFSSGIRQRDDVRLGVGDDAALVVAPAGQVQVMSMDTLVAGVHFPIETTATNIGYKALAVNLSDLAAMGATPAWAMLALTLPETDETWLDGFCQGFSELASKYNVSLIGGDTTSGPLTISVQISGFVPEPHALKRSGAQVGDHVFVSGQLGDAGLGLLLQMQKTGLELSKSQQAYFCFYILGLLYAGWKLYNIRTGVVLSLMLIVIGLFGLWEMMIYTLVIVVISVFVSILLGLPIGIFMAKSDLAKRIIMPILDGMQTMPSFVYLLPAVMFFGFGRVPAIIATTSYAIAPLVRLTYLGISSVNKEVIEAGKSFGSTSKQMLLKIEFPQALSSIMTGVNQTTMMAMAMVVISSMIGAEGIGEQVLIAIRRQQIGRGLEAGFGIVFLAIILDRVLQGAAQKLKERS